MRARPRKIGGNEALERIPFDRKALQLYCVTSSQMHQKQYLSMHPSKNGARHCERSEAI
jgi:hypothetical protein